MQTGCQKMLFCSCAKQHCAARGMMVRHCMFAMLAAIHPAEAAFLALAGGCDGSAPQAGDAWLVPELDNSLGQLVHRHCTIRNVASRSVGPGAEGLNLPLSRAAMEMRRVCWDPAFAASACTALASTTWMRP